MANTFELIASSTVGSGGAASIDFTSIPSTYTDLVILVSARSVRAQTQDGMNIKFNSSTSSFSGTYVATVGTTPQSGTLTNGSGSIPAANATASTFSNHQIYIPNYASANNKSYSIDSGRENNSATVFELDLIAGLWSNSSAITSIGFYNDNANFAQYSTAYLYGVKNA